MSTILEPNPTTERYLKCKIDKGMFSDEMVVSYPPDGEAQKTVFVPSTFVIGTPGQTGQVRVRLIKRDNWLMAVLPSSYQDIVTVREEDLTAQ